ncbi:hypothetical protein OESDEN_04926 [Oesophagostomum dentatum]|uniref:Uncharacterized protein n=1 Tax=Oesophagostomum dentatum TaxID=61180 RepID=A0A0B1TIE3_OESDE|nr:hypothetical protein OESDEN_04926 [Oesophagostomum dentatum]
MLPLLLALLQMPSSAMAEGNATEDDRRVHCPRPESATSSCDAPTFFTYYSCCGEENMFCCMHLQIYVIIGAAVILLAVLIALLTCFVRWICRIKRKGHQSYDFS